MSQFADQLTLNISDYIGENDIYTLINFISDTKIGIRHNKIMMFHGPCNSGKTILINKIINYLGTNNVAILPFNLNLYNNKPAPIFAGLGNIKLIIIDNIQNTLSIKSSLRQLLSDDKFIVRRLYSNAEYITPTWNILICSDQENLFDNDSTMEDRITMISFPNKFSNKIIST